MEKVLMALDGTNMLYRAYFGVRPLTTREGLPTHAIYGFLNILRSILNEYKPDALCVTFDMDGPTFRKGMYEGYKADRKPMEEDLAAQLPLIREVLEALNIPIFELQGYEADDLLGTMARITSESGWNCLLVSGDRDLYQLIDDRTSVLHLSTRETIFTDKAKIREKYGMEPQQLLDLKALMGDASDRIPGVPGIGEKTALSLIQTWHSLDNIYEVLHEIPEKFKKKLEPGKDLAYLSRTLGKICCEAPIDFKPEHVMRQSANTEKLRNVFNKLEFTRMYSNWLSEAPKTGEQTELFVENELPDGVARDAKSIWLADLVAGRELTSISYDAKLAAWMLQHPESEWSKMRSELEELGMWKLYSEVEMPLSMVLARMEHYGVAADGNKLREYGEYLQAEINKEKDQIYELAGQEFNILSPKQLGEVLFSSLGLRHGKKTKTGWSTDADTLELLRNEHPIIGKILNYRTLAKLKSTYADGLLKVLDENERIHSTFQMTATVTGRLSSTEPNLQNIPVRTELGGRLREMFTAGREGRVLVDADYSQIELRVLAHISGDSVMRDAFRSGEDIHAVTASQVFSVPLEMVTPIMRRHAKAVNFGIVYGIGDFSLAADIGVTRAEARSYIDNYLEKYSGVRAYMHDIVESARRDGYVATLFGRRRYIPEILHSNANMRKFGERAAMNAPIQGTAADIIKMAMIAVDRRLHDEKLESRLVLTVHDELICECPESEAERVAALVHEEMENVFPLDPPLLAEAKIGKTWADAK